MKLNLKIIIVFLALVNFLSIKAYGQDLNFNEGHIFNSIFSNLNSDNESKNESETTIPEGNGSNTLLKGRVTKVPSGTKLKIIVETPIDELNSKLDDEVSFRLSEDVLIDDLTVIPSGSTLSGKLTEINLAKRLHKAGTVRIEFNNLTLPEGNEVPIVASVLTRNGLIKGKFTKKNILLSSASILGPTAAGVGAGLVVADSSVLGAGIGAAAGAVAGLALYSFQKGNMIDIMAGDEMEVELTEETMIPTAVGLNDITNNEEKKFCDLK